MGRVYGCKLLNSQSWCHTGYRYWTVIVTQRHNLASPSFANVKIVKSQVCVCYQSCLLWADSSTHHLPAPATTSSVEEKVLICYLGRSSLCIVIFKINLKNNLLSCPSLFFKPSWWQVTLYSSYFLLIFINLFLRFLSDCLSEALWSTFVVFKCALEINWLDCRLSQ